MPSSSGGSNMDRLDASAVAAGRATAIVAAGSRFAFAAGGAVRLASSDANTLLPLPPGVAGRPIASLAASRSGRLVAAGERGSKPALYLWAAAPPGTAQPPGQEIARGLHSFSVAALAFSPSGRLLASHGGDRDYQVAVWAPTVSDTAAKPQGRIRLKESFDALAFAGEERLAAINCQSLVVFYLERCSLSGGLPMILTVSRSIVLPSSPAPSRFVGLAALPDVGGRAQPRLVAAAEGGRVMVLRPGGPAIERSVDVQERHVLSMAAVSSEHVALGCPSGIKLLAAASLETVAELAVPAGSAHCRIEACAFSPDGGTLLASTGGAELLSFSVHDPRQPVLLRQQHQGNSEAVTGAAVIPGTTQLATCSSDGQLLLWDCAPAGAAQLACVAALELCGETSGTFTKLRCLSASPNGRLLAAGDNTGRVHIVLKGPSLSLLDSQPVVQGEVSALCFGPGIGSSTPLLAVGSRSGGVSVLCLETDGSCTEVASLADHKGPVIGLALTADGLLTASQTKRSRYTWDASARGLVPAGAEMVPKGSALAALAAAQQGRMLVAVSRAGKATIWQTAADSEPRSVQLLDRMQGEVTAIAVDDGGSLLVCTSTRNNLLAFSLPSGKLLAAGRAHTAGSSVGQVLIMPGTGCIVTAGDDSCVCAYPLPPGLASRCQLVRLAEQEPVPAAAPEAAPPAGSAAQSGSRASSQRIQPRDLTSLIDSAASSPATASAVAVRKGGVQPSGPAEGQLAEIPSASASEATGFELPEPPLGSLQRTTSIPPSPNRLAVLAGRQQQQQQLEELQAPAPTALARSPALPQPASACASASTPLSPAILFGSPLETLSSISPGLLQSPDVFADLAVPSPGAAALAVQSASSPGLVPERGGSSAAKPAPAAPGSGVKAASLRRLASMMGWRSSGRRPAVSQGDPLADADAERCEAMFELSEGTGHAGTAPTSGTAPTPSPAALAFFSPAGTSPRASAALAATCDIGATLEAVPSSVSVNQPLNRRSWGRVPSSSEGPRRALSAHSLSSVFGREVGQDADVAERAHSFLGAAGGPVLSTADSWSIFEDTSDTAAPGSAVGSASGTASASQTLSRRLSFSFGGFGGFGIAKPQKADEEDIPTLQAKGAAVAAACPPERLPSFEKPRLAATNEQGANCTPRLFLGGCLSSRAPDGVPAPAWQVQLALSGPPQHLGQARTPSPRSGDATLPATTASSTVAGPNGLHSLGLQGRPTVPMLDLSTLPGGGTVALSTIAPGKRSRLASESGPLAESTGSAACGRPGRLSAQRTSSQRHAAAACSGQRSALPATAAAAVASLADVADSDSDADCAGSQRESKKSRPLRRSPPRIIITSALFSYSAEKAKAPVRASAEAPGPCFRRDSGSFWHAAASSVGAASPLYSASCSPGSHVGDEDDPFCRPAAHDPLEGHATPAINLQPSAPPPLSGLPSDASQTLKASLCVGPTDMQPGPFAAAASEACAPGGAGPCQGQASPAEQAAAVQPDMLVSAVLQLLEQGLAGLTSLEASDEAALDAASQQRFSGLLHGIAAAGSRLTARMASRPAGAAEAVDSGEQENVGGNAAVTSPPVAASSAAAKGVCEALPSSGAGQQSTESPELAAFKAEVRRKLADLKRLLLAGRA